MEFRKAERKQAKLRLGITGASGGGKTHSALLIAKGIGGSIALIDTEHGSGSLEVGKPGIPEYDTLELDPPFTPQRYIEAIRAGESASYNVIIVDSLSHEWQGEGGALDMHDRATAASKSGNSYTAWKEVTPQHDKLVNAILQSKCHIIATMRTKQDYVQVEENNKKAVKKLGMAPVQREGMDYEFTVVLDLSQEHVATATKDRTSLFDGQHFTPSEETGKQLLEWLNKGAAVPAPAPKPVAPTPQAPPPEVGKQTEPTEEKMTEAQRAKIFASAKEMTYNDAGIHALLSKLFPGKTSLTELTKVEAGKLIEAIEQGETVTVPPKSESDAAFDQLPSASESHISLSWLNESLVKIGKEWSAGKWLKETFGLTGQSWKEVLEKMTDEQKKQLKAKVQEMLELA
jgi:hypothetical protein